MWPVDRTPQIHVGRVTLFSFRDGMTNSEFPIFKEYNKDIWQRISAPLQSSGPVSGAETCLDEFLRLRILFPLPVFLFGDWRSRRLQDASEAVSLPWRHHQTKP